MRGWFSHRASIFGTFFAAVLGVVFAVVPAHAQLTEEQAAREGANPFAPSGDLETLLSRLAEATSKRDATRFERAVIEKFYETESATIELLMARVDVAIKAEDYTVAIGILDNIIELDPDYAEAWNKRATVNYINDEYAASLKDLERVLALQPKHFGAIYGLGLIMQTFGAEDLAKDAFARALEINPYLDNAQKQLDTIEEKLERSEI